MALQYEYTTTPYAQNFLLSLDMTTFELHTERKTVGGVPTTSRPLTRVALFGYDDMRVYASDFVDENVIREFGTYDEIGEVVFDIRGVDFPSTFRIGDSSLVNFQASELFSPGDTIRVSENISLGTQDFTVASATGEFITVNEVIPPEITDYGFSGNIINVTKPVRPEDGIDTNGNSFTFTNVESITVYVVGIEFLTTRVAGTNVKIIVGASAIDEIGTGNIKVITSSGVQSISTTGYRIVEQIKTTTNQYPLFDIFTVEGEPAFLANSIFGYRTSSDEPINLSVGLRIIYDTINDIYDFDQFLLEEDNGELFAYRDYANKQNDFWFNKETNELKFWDDIAWSDKTAMSQYYRRAIVSSVEPSDPADLATADLYWYNTVTDTLFRRFSGSWLEITGVDQLVTDANLQTIWKAGNNNELYVPAEVDWVRRSEVEYNDAQAEFVTVRVIELLTENPSMTEVDATTLATEEWYESQSNHISPTGVWVGDWEIPAPLYYNHLHENKKYLSSRELFTHFTTIINEQEPIPGWSGTKQGQFNLVHINDINYGLGGTIKEFNNGFDTLISSVMVNNVTPPSLFEFAHDQYEILLNALKEIYRENAVSLLSDVSSENIVNLSSNMADTIIGLYELNDNTAFLYGDSTTFTDNSGINDLGVRNWIATLPYLNLVHRVAPQRIVDRVIGLDEVVHHDGHRDSYEITEASTDVISKTLVASEDPRFAGEFLGVESSTLPVNTISEFITSFNTIANREGVYWYHNTPSPSVLYRYIVVSSSDAEPPLSDYENGVLWMDLTAGLEVLRTKVTDTDGVESWDIVDGLTVGDGRFHNGTDPSDLSTATISAWELTDLNVILGDIIFNLENRLYENVDDTVTLNYDVEVTAADNVTKAEQYTNEAFLSFVSQAEIDDPFKNDEFDATDPYTWNYKRSAPDGNVTIISADELTNSFVVAGDRTTTFVPYKPFYVKNSEVNDGTWTVISGIGSPVAVGSIFDGVNTTIYVTGDVKAGILGSIYSGTLPSPIDAFSPNNLNDGSESGGDWRDLYERFYGTPYPHLEPWILQGYTSKPIWWDTEYLNDNIALWGDRTWKHKHGFDIIAFDNAVGSPANQSLTFEGVFEELFVSTKPFAVDNTVGSPAPLTYTVETLETIQVVNPGIAGIANFTITDAGFASATYVPGMKISITNAAAASSSTLTQNYTIRSVNLSGSNFTIVVEEEILVGDLTVGTDFINGAISDTNTNTTTVYTTATIVLGTSPVDGRVAVSHGMWENVRLGLIPAGAVYPNGVTSVTGNPATDASDYGLSTEVLPKFNYFSVNIDNVSVSSDGGITNILPDGLLPPYWDYTAMYPTPGLLNNMVSSLYANFSIEIVAPNANYLFGDRGHVEWNWKASSQYLYDQLTIAYRIDPARFIYNVFGFNFTTIGGLLIDRDVRNTASHTRTNFHGDVVDNEQFKSEGINQWYVNFNRYTGYDTNFSDFQSLWTLWAAPLTYQFASYIDTPSLSVAHRYVELTNFDHEITSKRSAGVEDFWLDALNVQILSIPYDIIRYNNQLDWRFEIKTNISQTREIKYYDVHNYQFQADSTTNECSIYTWNINSVDAFDNEFTILGDQENIFVAGRQFTILDSTNNDGTYTISYSSYDTVSKITTITVDATIPSSIVDGKIKLIYRTIPWETGDAVYLSTSETMPIPLDGDTVIGTTKYFIIKVSDTTFKIANKLTEALADTEIPITANGVGDHYVGEILTTFTVSATGDIIWRHYAPDKSNILSWSTPKQIQGMQHLVDIIHGYELHSTDNGWFINADNKLRDPDTNAIVTWQVELERFVEYAYDTRSRRAVINNRYPVTVDTATDEFTFVDSNLIYITADPVVLVSSNGIYPTPLSRGLTYYIIRENLESVKLATSRTDAQAGVAIDILSITGTGDLSLMTPTSGRYLIPSFEMNPFRNAVWFNQPFGIVSNVITGPSDDIRTTQLIFDQYGNTVHTDQLRVYRRDTETKIVIKDAVNTTPQLTFVNDDYNQLHLGGLHIFTDSYEHVLMFNNYTAGDNLLYDPFIGLNVTKYEMLFNRNPEFTGRPNVGGYYLETFFNQGANIKENFEAGVENLRNAYDTFDTFESNLMTTHARDSLGYNGVENYLSDLNISEKSQFIFWRGQIQTKGSINAIKAYINSRRFIDAKIDEFWAIKVADFGSSKEKEYPEMFATTVDARSNEFKVEFICSEDDGSNVSDGFTAIKMSDTERWYNQPEQLEVLRNNGKLMYFDMKMIAQESFDFNDVVSDYIVHGLDIDVVDMSATPVAAIPETGFDTSGMATQINSIGAAISSVGSGFVIKIDGTQIWYTGSGDTQIFTSVLGTPYDISTMGAITGISFPVGNGPKNITISPDGFTLMFQRSGGIIEEYTLSPAWDVSSLSLTASSAIFNPGANTDAAYFSRDGFHVYAADRDEIVYSFTLASAWDISSATKDAYELGISAHATNGWNQYVSVNEDGTKLYYHSFTSPMHIWTMATPWELSTATWTSEQSFSASTPRMGFWADGGLRYYVTADSNLYQWDTGFGDGAAGTDGVLIEGTDYEYINPNVVKILDPVIVAGSPVDLTISGYVVNNDVSNPSRLIDRSAEVQLSTIEYWDPARGHHYSLAIHNVDLQNHNDPAVYSITPQIITDNRTWASEFVGTSWMDTSTMDYVPYHSDKVITDDSSRFREWGQLHDYASINLYEWVESDVPPSGWDAIAETEEGDNTIPEAERKAGVAKFTLFEPEVAGSPVTSWVPLKNKVDTQNAAISVSGVFTIDLSVIDNTKVADVYINEIKQSPVQPTGSPAILPTTVSLTIKENDIVKFVQAVPTTADVIATEVAAGNLRQEYEYTTVDEYDSFGSLSTKYYFWVGNKRTKPLDKNRLMSLAEAEQQLVSIPSAYMFYQKPLATEDIVNTSNIVSRSEYYTAASNTITLAALIASATTVEVVINGEATTDITYIADGTSDIVTINTPAIVATDEVRVTYTGTYTSNLPNRFSQVIIRGLQGIVFDDSRYTIRFTRDFTLRDNLDVDNVEIGPLDLNNFHEEWKIFRKEQEAKVDRWMWNKVTESIVGYLLTDSTVRVPSYEYELYDEKFGTDTQYGLDTNQTFVNGTLGLSTIIAYLIDPTIDFAPININTFFNDYSFDTAENIITAMDYIYTEFTVTDVNRIYFSVLFDAFTTKNKYPGIFKTSMVSLHGIRPLQNQGFFDD